MEKLLLSREAWLAVIAHCRQKAPDEACGVLAGRLIADGQTATMVISVQNVRPSPTYYEMDPRGLLAAIDQAEVAGLEEVAYFHSHPASPPTPSQTDIGKARIGTSRMLIVSLADPLKPAATFHLLGNGRAVPGELVVGR